MKAIFRWELRELMLVGVPLLAVAALAGSNLTGPKDETPAFLNVAMLAGLAVGVFQGLLDRRRDADFFYLHRPVPRVRREAGRLAAGLAVCAAAAAVFLIAFAWATPDDLTRPAWRPETAAVLEALGLLVATWAVMRFVLSIRSRMALLAVLVVLPMFALARFTRMATPGASVAYALGLAGVCAAFRFARARAVLILVLAGGVVLEGGFWLRGTLAASLHDLYPQAGITRRGRLHIWDVTSAPTTHLKFDRERREVRRWSGRDLGNGPPGLFFGVDPRLLRLSQPPFATRPHGEARPLEIRFASVDPVPPSHREFLGVLNRNEADRRGFEHPIRRLGGDLARLPAADGDRIAPPVFWTVADGRIVCRGRERGAEIASLGALPEVRNVLTNQPVEPHAASVGLWLAEPRGEAFRLTIPGGQRTERTDPRPLDVRVDPVPLPGPAAPARVLDRALDRHVALLHRGDRLLLLDETGRVLAEEAWDASEHWNPGGRTVHPTIDLGDEPIRWLALATELAPAHPLEVRLRLRLFRAGEPTVREDVILAPRTFAERLVGFAGGATTLLRPPVLNLAAAASAPPATWAELNTWWWRAPYLAGGRYAGWLLASLVLGFMCAWCARGQARVRCGTRRDVVFWSAVGLVLGPLGLAWMWMVVGRLPVERVGSGRRAVNLDAAPAAADPWPEPDPSPVEVLVR